MSTTDDLTLDEPLYGAKAIGKCRYVQRNANQTKYLLSNGLLDADKRGRLWVTTPRRLRDQLVGSTRSDRPVGRTAKASAQTNNAAGICTKLSTSSRYTSNGTA
jgi:hypothetical protein